MTNWKSIKTVPKDGTEFLAFYSSHGAIEKMAFDCENNRFVQACDYTLRMTEEGLTHWMPLPGRPAGENSPFPLDMTGKVVVSRAVLKGLIIHLLNETSWAEDDALLAHPISIVREQNLDNMVLVPKEPTSKMIEAVGDYNG